MKSAKDLNYETEVTIREVLQGENIAWVDFRDVQATMECLYP
jgi:hypothetical protein